VPYSVCEQEAAEGSKYKVSMQLLQSGTLLDWHSPPLQVYSVQRTSPQGFGGPHCSSEVHGWHCPVLSQNPVQVSQLSAPPQPSGQVPQVWPSDAHVVGVQHEPLSQVCPDGQEPQSNAPPQASAQVPHAWPSEAHVPGGG
jgi:hypothetical protein